MIEKQKELSLTESTGGTEIVIEPRRREGRKEAFCWIFAIGVTDREKAKPWRAEKGLMIDAWKQLC